MTNTNTVKLTTTITAQHKELENISKFERQSDKQLNQLVSVMSGGRKASQLYVLEGLARLAEHGATKTLQHYHDKVLRSDSERQHFIAYLLNHVWSGKDSIPTARNGGWSGRGLKGKAWILSGAPNQGRPWLWVDNRSETIAKAAAAPSGKPAAGKGKGKGAKAPRTTDEKVASFVRSIYPDYLSKEDFIRAVTAQWEKVEASEKSKKESTRTTKRTATRKTKAK